jgi:hypothetical protein
MVVHDAFLVCLLWTLPAANVGKWSDASCVHGLEQQHVGQVRWWRWRDRESRVGY